MTLQGPTLLVTGASGALGAGLVRALGGGGARIVAVDVEGRSEALDRVVAEVEGAVPLTFDASRPEAWSVALARLEASHPPVSGAVLAAGGWAGGAAFHESDPAELRAQLALNLETAAASLRALLPGMVARGAGSIVVVGSRAVERPWESARAAAYAASKAALVALAGAVAAEVREKGVRVNAVLPSTLDTPANRAAMPGADPARWVSVDSLAGVVAFLLSDAARDVSGAAVPVYGRA